jgi:hypothetical protein
VLQFRDVGGRTRDGSMGGDAMIRRREVRFVLLRDLLVLLLR